MYGIILVKIPEEEERKGNGGEKEGGGRERGGEWVGDHIIMYQYLLPSFLALPSSGKRRKLENDTNLPKGFSAEEAVEPKGR